MIIEKVDSITETFISWKGKSYKRVRKCTLLKIETEKINWYVLYGDNWWDVKITPLESKSFEELNARYNKIIDIAMGSDTRHIA